MTKQEKIDIIHAILVETIQVRTSWKEITDAIKEELTIKNWMLVRGVLQWMLNNQKIERYNSVHVEEYTYLSSKAI